MSARCLHDDIRTSLVLVMIGGGRMTTPGRDVWLPLGVLLRLADLLRVRLHCVVPAQVAPQSSLSPPSLLIRSRVSRLHDDDLITDDDDGSEGDRFLKSLFRKFMSAAASAVDSVVGVSRIDGDDDTSRWKGKGRHHLIATSRHESSRPQIYL